MKRSEAIWLLNCLENLRLCQRDECLFEDGDRAYYFTLEDGLTIYGCDLTDLCSILEANCVYIVTDEKADPHTYDQLCIYYKKVKE